MTTESDSMKLSKKYIAISVIALILLGAVAGVSLSSTDKAEEVTELTIYSGRSEEYIAPFLLQWEKESGIKLNIRYGDSAELSAQILEEGKNSPADLFLSQDAGSLGAIADAGLFTPLDSKVVAGIPAKYIAANRNWVGITARVRVFAYSLDRLKTLPASYADLVDAKYKDQIGIAPTNSSFQAFVSALIEIQGRDVAKSWLEAMKANGAKTYLKNSNIVEAIDAGEINIGLVNHYYVWEVSESLGRPVKAAIGFFKQGDVGNLINVSGAGVMATSKKQEAAQALITFFTSAKIQQKFVTDTHEYSLLNGAASPADLPALDKTGAPSVDLNSLKNIRATQDLLIEVGLL